MRRFITKDVWGLGLDLGKVRDHSALAALRFKAWEDHRRVPYPVIAGSQFELQYCERLSLGTTYEAVIARVLKVCTVLTKTAPVYLVIDSTGVGAPVVEAVQSRLRAAHTPFSMSAQGWMMGNNPVMVRPLVITGGEKATYEGVVSKVPKKDLVARLALELEAGHISMAKELPLLEELLRELSAFKSVMKSAQRAAMEATDGEHDDLVLALAMAVWWIRDRGVTYGGRNFPLGVQGGS